MKQNNPYHRWCNENSLIFLERSYLEANESLDEKVHKMVTRAFDEILQMPHLKKQFIKNIELGYYSFSTPVWSNFGNKKGLPISCFGSFVGDSVSSILYHSGEVGMMSKYGGGTSGDYSYIRSRGSETNNGNTSGSVHFLRLIDTLVNVISQGKVRRGNYAAYLSVEHQDIMEFLEIRSEGHPIQDLSFGVTIPNGWMESMINGNTKKRQIWAKILEVRSNVGRPYIIFLDNVNYNKPQVYKDKNMQISHSNLCSEIFEYTDINKSFVCCLASMNLKYYDEWKNTDAVQLLTYFQDAVMSEFIEKLENFQSDGNFHQHDKFFMQRALNFAKEHRALGIGVIGFHTYLQSKMLPFTSAESKSTNIEIFKFIEEQTEIASRFLADKYGEPKMLKGYNKRNTTLRAIAPTVSSSYILGGVSHSIEPYRSNYFVNDKAKIKTTFKNPYLKTLLKKKNMDNDLVWLSILNNKGSIQRLDFLSQQEKNVFKTFSEISQFQIIEFASDRQRYIDQGQSLNLTITNELDVKEINTLHITAWKLGLKSLYYQFSENAAQLLSQKLNNQDCLACQA